jgi:hypothetical protein
MTEFGRWQNFYVIVGSSAGALIGLQFVVLSLLTDRRLARPDPAAGRAFSTPSIVHFAVVLGLAGLISAPWNGLVPVAVLWALIGLCGVIYAAIVGVRIRRQSAYRPQFEDWLFHVALPLAAYATLLGAAFAASSHLRDALFGASAAALLLLYIGIHNAWDAVTYHVFR